MVKLVNRAKMTTATTGTGTITLGSAVDGFQTFDAAGVADADVVRYVIEDDTAWEIGEGTYSSAGVTLTRNPSESSVGGSAISLSGNAIVFVTAAGQDVLQPGDNISELTNNTGFTTNTGTVTSVAVSSGAGISISGSPITTSGTITVTNDAPMEFPASGIAVSTGSDWATSLSVATDANIRAGVANTLVPANNIYSSNAPVATSGTGTYTPDLNAGRVFQRTMTGNTTLANPTNQVAGQSGIIYMIQDGAGGRTLSFGSDWKPIGGDPSIDDSANAVNVFSYYVRSSGSITLSYLGAE